MPKYDAFGREIGEDTLAGLGSTSEPTVDARPEPAPATADGWTATVPPETPIVTVPDAPPRIKVRRTRGLGCFVGLLILAAVAVGPVIAIVSIVDQAGDAFDEVTGVIDPDPEVAPPDLPEAEPEPVGVDGRSMIATANVAGTLQKLRDDGAKSVVRISIWPNRLETEPIKGRRQRTVQFSYEGGVQRGDANPVNPALGSIKLADIDPGAPARLVRNSAKRFRVRERGINYVIGSEDVFSGSGHRWVAYFKNGIYVEGDERGRVVRRIN